MQPFFQNVEDNAVFLEAKLDGTQIGVLVVKDDKVINAAILGGPDRDSMKKIYSSVKGKN